MLEGWPAEVLDELVERDLLLSPTLTVMEVAISPEILRQVQRRVGEYRAAGGRVTVGSNSGMPGIPSGADIHRELALLVASGLTPQEALKGATSVAAKVLRSNRLGAIAPGREADMVTVAGDPLQNMMAAGNVVVVFRDGWVVIDRQAK